MEYKDIGSVDLNGTKGEALMDDDGCDDDCAAHPEKCNGVQESIKPDETMQKEKNPKEEQSIKKQESVLSTNDTTSVETPPQLDESSPRGAIVEVSPRLTRARSTKDCK